MTDFDFCLGQLRHLYAQLKAGTVTDHAGIADGLLSPVIQKLERQHDDAVARAEAAEAALEDAIGFSFGGPMTDAPLIDRFREGLSTQNAKIARHRGTSQGAAMAEADALRDQLADVTAERDAALAKADVLGKLAASDGLALYAGAEIANKELREELKRCQEGRDWYAFPTKAAALRAELATVTAERDALRAKVLPSEHRNLIAFLEADLGSLNALLANMGDVNVLGRMGLESRKRDVEAELARLRGEE